MQYQKLTCPNPSCRVVLAVPREMQGQQVRCAGCGELLLVPLTALPNRRSLRNEKNHTRRAA